MVSPPFPMTNPAFPAGIISSWTVPFWPLVASGKGPGGPPRPRDTMSSSSAFAFLGRGWGITGGIWGGFGDVWSHMGIWRGGERVIWGFRRDLEGFGEPGWDLGARWGDLRGHRGGVGETQGVAGVPGKTLGVLGRV